MQEQTVNWVSVYRAVALLVAVVFLSFVVDEAVTVLENLYW